MSGPASLLALRGVGPALERRFIAGGIATPRELATTYPREYKDWREPLPIAAVVETALRRENLQSGAHLFAVRTNEEIVGDQRLKSSESNEVITVGRIVRLSEYRGRLSVLTAELEDETGRIKATWFGRSGLGGTLSVGVRLFVHGRAAVRRSRRDRRVELNVLHHSVLAPGEPYHGRIVPVYPASKELPSRTIASVIERNADALAALVDESVPSSVSLGLRPKSLREAWYTLHKPPTPEAAAAARERIVFEEFFALALAAALKRAQRRAHGGARPLVPPPGLLDRFIAAQPFGLTAAQRRVIGELWADMAGAAPMNRLLQGDVGSGKTLVAAATIVLAASAGVQSALMAPTEILAAQHARKLAPLLLSLGLRLDALYGGMSARERAATLSRLESGACEVVVGTHALLSGDVVFRDLALVIIDEQHRFGVAQRAKLRGKSRSPHTLHMTATPIPRTLAQTKFADLDLSVIDELPPGRTPVQTYVLRASRKGLAYQFVRKNVAAGRQAYIVAPAIDESETALTSALAELEALRHDVFPDLRIELLHGRLPPHEKDAAMNRFVRHEADVLLATTVVEVGIDVANASVMIVLDAHRYGLAQLHQLRGRVGRGVARSYCVLLAPDEMGAVERLEILARSNDGFAIAEEDLRLRGEGEFSGTAQAGGSRLLGSIVSDFALYMRAKSAADALVSRDPDLTRPEHGALRARLDGDADRRSVLVSS